MSRGSALESLRLRFIPCIIVVSLFTAFLLMGTMTVDHRLVVSWAIKRQSRQTAEIISVARLYGRGSSLVCSSFASSRRDFFLDKPTMLLNTFTSVSVDNFEIGDECCIGLEDAKYVLRIRELKRTKGVSERLRMWDGGGGIDRFYLIRALV